MEERTIPQRLLRGILVVGVIGAFVLVLPERFGESQASRHRPPAHRYRCAVSPSHPEGSPCRVVISSIGVDARVIRLGTDQAGHLEVPTDWSVTGWWSGGPQPGQRGPAVIVGHVDSKAGPAVFFHLHDLDKGAVVKVYRAGLPPATFAVQWGGEWPKSDFPSKLVYGATSYPALRLVTCGGDFDHSTGHYVDNIVVFARKIA